MKRNQSFLESSISNFYFSVCPTNLTFFKDYYSKFTLYYEKSLQIITKFQTPLQTVHKDEIVNFITPSNIQHFRIQSQKNLDYQWSLYMHQESDAEENQEFMEGQKISLKIPWQNFQEKKEGVCELQQEFNAVKCKLNYIVLIGKSNAELVQSAQQYFQSVQRKRTIVTPKDPVPKLLIEEVEIKQQTKREEVLVQPCMQSRERVGDKSYEQISNIKMETQKQKQDTDIVQVQLPIQTLKESKILNDYQYRDSNQLTTPKRGENQPDNEPKLSKSQIQIGKFIEKEVQTYEATKSIEIVIPEYVHEEVVQSPPLQQQSKEIVMTQSQLLNEKREVIAPIYKRKSFIILITVIALLMAGLAAYSFRAQAQKPKETQGKKQKAAKEQKTKVQEKPKRKAKK